jgi:glycerophosphoryl diester phosphodiesterase
MHDDTLDRTTNGYGFVSEKSLQEIKQLDAGLGEKVPTLQEALNLIDRKVPIIIEMTGFLSSAKNIATILTSYVVHKGWDYSDFMVSSYIHKEVVALRNILPMLKIGVNISAIPLSYARFAQEAGADFLATENLYLTDDAFVKDAHKRGLHFFVYSVDDPVYLKRYEAFGIDGVFSNAPDRIKSTI